MPGTFDGAGAFLANSNTIRIRVNHETSEASISEVNVNKEKLQEAINIMIEDTSPKDFRFVRNARLEVTLRIVLAEGRTISAQIGGALAPCAALHVLTPGPEDAPQSRQRRLGDYGRFPKCFTWHVGLCWVIYPKVQP